MPSDSRWGKVFRTFANSAVLCLTTPLFLSGASQIQLFLAVLVLAFFVALLVQLRLRRRARVSLANRYALEKQISEFSERLAETTPEHIDSEIEIGLRNVLGLENGTQASWYVKSDNSEAFERKYFVGKPSALPSPRSLAIQDIPWGMERLLSRDSIVVARVRDFPPNAEPERRFFEQFSGNSIALVPATYGPCSKGLLVLASASSERRWTPESVSHLRVLGTMIASAAQRTHAQRAQTESEVRFQHLFEQSSIGIALETLDGRFLHVNPALCAMLAYQKADLLGLNRARVSHLEDLEAEKPLLSDLRQGLRSSYQLQKRFLRSDGSSIWADVSVSLLMGTEQQAPLVVGMVRDITLNKAAQERLVVSETRLQSTLDVLSAAIAILDERATILAVNAQWTRLACEGEPRFRGFVIGANFFEISAAVTGDDAEPLKEVAERLKVLLSGASPGDPLLQRSWSEPKGEVWYHVIMARFEETGSPRIVLSHLDVTELIRVRTELAQNQERLSMTLEASNTGTWEWDIVGARFLWRDNQMSTGGEREKEFRGDYRRFLEFVHPEDRRRIEDATEQTLRGGGTFSAEFRISEGKGTERWYLAKGKIFRDFTGRPIRMLGVNVDITELKRRDLELHELASRLIKAQEDERRRISRELHDDIGQRVSLLANELESLTHETLSKEQPHTMEIQNLRKQADELATDIHELSHELHSSKLQHLGLRAALRELCEKISEKRQLQVSLQTDGTETRLSPDVALCLYRVAQEALNNAIKHSHAQQVNLQTGRSGDVFRLTVRDTGVGFDPATAPPGLGLIGMRERLRTIGGHLQVKSSPLSGTEVTAEVTAAEQAASAHI